MEALMPVCNCFTSGGIINETNYFLSCAPCPPPMFSYNEFVSFAETKNLTSCEIDKIADKCKLEEGEDSTWIPDVVAFPSNDTDASYSREPHQTSTSWEIPTICILFTIGLTVILILVLRHKRKDRTEIIKAADQKAPEKYGVQYNINPDVKQGILNAAFTNSNYCMKDETRSDNENTVPTQQHPEKDECSEVLETRDLVMSDCSEKEDICSNGVNNYASEKEDTDNDVRDDSEREVTLEASAKEMNDGAEIDPRFLKDKSDMVSDPCVNGDIGTQFKYEI